MDLIRPIDDKVKAARSGSRLQNRACDQCRRSKRRCDLAEAGPDGLPIQHAGPCKLCVRKNLQCTTHWSALQQTVSSSRQELRHISQTSASYTALQDQLSSHQYLPAGLSSASKSLSDNIDGSYISTKQLFTYVAAWEWIWQHFLGSGATPAGVGLDAAVHPRRGLLSNSAARAWDNMMVVNNVPHISPNFFYSTFVCDEAFRPVGRFKRLPKKADEISMKALQYSIVAYASQYGSQNLGEWRGDDSDKLRRQKDTEIAEAAWMRARDFLMAHSSVTTFRMAYALHLFCNTCPPLRSNKANFDVVQDSVFMLQTGLRMMDDLATDLLRQQDEDLFAIGYHNTDGARIDDEVYLRSEPTYRARVERAHALKDVAENLLWYSAICDAASTSGFGMPPIVRSSSSDKVDLDAMQLTAALPAASISASRHTTIEESSFSASSGPFAPIPDAGPPFGQNGYVSMPNVSPDPNTNPAAMNFGDSAMLRLEPTFMMPAAAMNGDFSSLHRDWLQRADPSATATHSVSLPGQGKQSTAGALSAPISAASDVPRCWTRIAQRALQASKQIPYIMSRFAAAPGDPARVKEFLHLCQTGASTQVMIWQRNGNFRAGLDDPSCTAVDLADHFQRTWSIILFVHQAFQPILDLDPHLYSQMPASAQSMATHLVNQVSMGSLLFLELCSFLEGIPWLQNSRDPSWPRASSMLRAQLDQSRDLRNEVRRRSALRIGKSHHLVAKQVERTLRYGGSPPRDMYDSEHSSPNGSSNKSHRGSDAGNSDLSEMHDSSRIEIPLPQDDMIVPALQIHSSRHPVPTHLACVLHISFCALVPDALQEISQHGAASPVTLDALDADLRGLQAILDSVLSFGPNFHRDPSLETLFSTRNWLAPDRAPLILTLR
ncbi:uncharacterized protein UTRI_00537 [Ustilago trichophora]|uniref:Zn(2)-C6 fungal-type domain-containing protein n=1 Tax=Ustilago trichophora TaxID=86804 RepID=A0A5C3DTS7_9BASI|nr:uncharacterized protein UTRI_00537 [Ustilago trichophora]